MNLREKIKNSGFKLSYIATQLGLSYTSIKKKMRGEVEFKATEIAILKQILNLSDSDISLIFFSRNSEYNSLKEKRWNMNIIVNPVVLVTLFNLNILLLKKHNANQRIIDYSYIFLVEIVVCHILMSLFRF